MTAILIARWNLFCSYAPSDKHFFVHSNYGGCENDKGWFTVADANVGTQCSWEAATDAEKPAFIYSKGTSKSVNTSGYRYVMKNLL